MHTTILINTYSHRNRKYRSYIQIHSRASTSTFVNEHKFINNSLNINASICDNLRLSAPIEGVFCHPIYIKFSVQPISHLNDQLILFYTQSNDLKIFGSFYAAYLVIDSL